MDIATLEPSRIITVARAAAERPDTEFLCFGESDQAFPPTAATALIDAVNRGDALYSDVRGVPALRHALAGYLTGLHARPVTESRIQVTSSGMTAVNVALAATVRSGDRVVLHGPAWPNPANAALPPRRRRLDHLNLARTPPLRPLPPQPRPTRCPMLPGTRAFVLNSPNNPNRLDRYPRPNSQPSSTFAAATAPG